MAGMPLSVLQVIADTARRGAQLFAVDLAEALGEEEIEVSRSRWSLGQHDGARRSHARPSTARGPDISALRREAVHADVAIAHGGQTLPACARATRHVNALHLPAGR